METNLHPANRDVSVVNIDISQPFELIGIQNNSVGILQSNNINSQSNNILKWIDYNRIAFNDLQFILPEDTPGGLYAVGIINNELLLTSEKTDNTVSFVHITKPIGNAAMFNRFYNVGLMRVFTSPLTFLTVSVVTQEQNDYITPLFGLPCLLWLSLARHTISLSGSPTISLTRDGFNSSWLPTSIIAETYATHKYPERYFLDTGGEIQVRSYLLLNKTYTIEMKGVQLI